MAVFSEENLRQCSSRGLERGAGFTGVFRTPSPHQLKWGAGGGLEEEIRFSWRLLFFPRQGGIFSDELCKAGEKGWTRLEAGRRVLPAPTSRGIRCESRDPGFFWGRQLMTLHPRGHTSCRTSHRAGGPWGRQAASGGREGQG